MFLQPSEVGFLKHLKEARVPVVEFEFPAKRIVNVQSQLEKLIGQNYYLNQVGSLEVAHKKPGTNPLFLLVGQRWLPLIFTSLRLSQSTLYFRRP